MNNEFLLEEFIDFHQPLLPCQSPFIFRGKDLSQSSETSEDCPDLIFYEENQPKRPSLLPDEMASLLLEKSKRIYKKPLIPKKTPKKSPSGPKRNRKSWTFAEDKILLRYQKKYGNQWVRIADHIPNRTGKQVRDRYLNVLSSDIVKKKPWTDEEDQVVMRKFEEMGPQWCRIADVLEGRSDTQVKNRYNTFLVKQEKESFNMEAFEVITAETSPKEMVDLCSEGDLLDWRILGLDS